MRFETKELNVFNGCLQIPIPRTLFASANKVMQAVQDGKLLEIKIDLKRKPRSLDANAYLWVILGEMAAVLHTDKDSLYLLMLERYGVYTHIVVKPHVVPRIRQEWRAVKELGEVVINGQKGIQLQCYFGSSTYNSKEFSVLLDGVISEAKELGIDTISEADKDLLLKEWGRK